MGIQLMVFVNRMVGIFSTRNKMTKRPWFFLSSFVLISPTGLVPSSLIASSVPRWINRDKRIQPAL